MKRSRGLLVAASIIILGVAVIWIGLKLYLPRYIEQRVVAEAKARGIELTPGRIRAVRTARRCFGYAGWTVSLNSIPYDHVAAANLAIARGYPKWAEVVTTGWPKPREL